MELLRKAQIWALIKEKQLVTAQDVQATRKEKLAGTRQEMPEATLDTRRTHTPARRSSIRAFTILRSRVPIPQTVP